MPVEFLSDEEATAYGRFGGPPPRAELERVFFFDDADRALIAGHRGEHNRLEFALQLATVRSLGLFPVDPLEVPSVVLDSGKHRCQPRRRGAAAHRASRGAG